MIRRSLVLIPGVSLLVIGLSNAPLAAQFDCEPFCLPPSYSLTGPDQVLEGDSVHTGDHAVQYQLVHTADDGTETLVNPSWGVMDPDDVLRSGSLNYAFRAIDDAGVFLVMNAARTGVVYVRAGLLVEGVSRVLFKPVTVTRRPQKLLGLSIPFDADPPALGTRSVTQLEAVADFRSGLPGATPAVQPDEWWLEQAPSDASVSQTGELTLGCTPQVGWTLKARYEFEGISKIAQRTFFVWPNDTMEPDRLYMTGNSAIPESVIEGQTAQMDSLMLTRRASFPDDFYDEAVPASEVQWSGSSSYGAISPSGLLSAAFYPPGTISPAGTVPVTAEYSECGQTVSRTFDVSVSLISVDELRIYANGSRHVTTEPVAGAQSIELTAQALLHPSQGGGSFMVPATWAFQSSVEGPSLSEDGVLTTLSAQCDELVVVTGTFRNRSRTAGFHMLPSPNSMSSFTVSQSGAYEGTVITGSIELAGPACDPITIPLSISTEPIVAPPGAPVELAGATQGRSVRIERGERSGSFDLVALTADEGMREDIAVTRVMIEAAYENDVQGADFALCSTSATMFALTAPDGTTQQEVDEGETARVAVSFPGGAQYAQSCGPMSIQLESSNPSVVSGTSLTLSGEAENITVEVRDVSEATEVGITAVLDGPSYGPASQPGDAQHTIVAIPVPSLSSIRISPSMTFEGRPTTVEVSLDAAASGRDIPIRLVSDDPSLLADLPRTVIVPDGARDATVAFTAPEVIETRTATVEAFLGDVTLSATVSIGPFSTLTTLTARSNRIIVGQTLDVIISLDKVASTGGLRIGLESSNPDLLLIDRFATIPAGEQSAVVTVTAAAVRGMRGGVEVVLRAIQGRTVVEFTVSVEAPGQDTATGT